MRLLTIATRSVQQRLLTSVLTSVSILLGAGLVSFLWLVSDQAEKRFNASSKGYRVILGPKDTSPLGIVLSTVFHIGFNTGVVPLSVYRDVHDNRRWRGGNVGLRYAIPIVLGDNYRGFPIVGTTDEWFTEFSRERDPKGKPLRPMRIVQGGHWKYSHEDLLAEAERQANKVRARRLEGPEHGGSKQRDGREGTGSETDGEHGTAPPARLRKVVIGAAVAAELGLGTGDKVIPAHGAESSLEEHADAACEVVGVLEETYTPIDRALYVPIGLCYRLEGHNAIHRDEEEIEPGKVEISAIIVDTRGPVGGQVFRSRFQRNDKAQAALPRVEIRTLFLTIGNIALALKAVSYLVLVVGAIAIFVALYNTMHERRRDVAIMRSLGARRAQILGIVLLEALLITALGAVLGILSAHGAAVVLAPWFQGLTGIPLSGTAFGLRELFLIFGVCLLGAFAGLLPAVKASMTDVARHLSAER